MRQLTRNQEALNIQTTVSEALLNLGLDEAFLISAMEASGYQSALSRNSRLRLSKITATEWLWLCEFLYMPLDLAHGNCLRMYQCKLVGTAILEGCFTLPRTEKVQSMLKQFFDNERQSIRFNKEHYGSPLLEKVILGRRKTVKERRLLRSKNRIRSLSKGEMLQSNTVFSHGLNFLTAKENMNLQTRTEHIYNGGQ